MTRQFAASRPMCLCIRFPHRSDEGDDARVALNQTLSTTLLWCHVLARWPMFAPLGRPQERLDRARRWRAELLLDPAGEAVVDLAGVDALIGRDQGAQQQAAGLLGERRGAQQLLAGSDRRGRVAGRELAPGQALEHLAVLRLEQSALALDPVGVETLEVDAAVGRPGGLERLGLLGRAGRGRAQPVDGVLEARDVAVEPQAGVELPARLALEQRLGTEHGPQSVRVVPEELLATAGRRLVP